MSLRPAGELLDRARGTVLSLADGHTVDAEGNVWVAGWSAGRVEGFAPDGRRIATIRVPVAAVTACGFGGPELATLFITTMRHPGPSGTEDKAGCLFAADPGTRGRTTRGFAG